LIFKKVTVVVKAGDRFYTVDGEVKGPDRKLYIGDTTVIRAIASAGGFTDFANRRKVKIIRASGQTEIIDCKKAEDPKHDRRICPGDVIIVPRSL
jgi:polysaccharide export outer membrane protein